MLRAVWLAPIAALLATGPTSVPGARARRAELRAADSTLAASAASDARALADASDERVVLLHSGLRVVRGRDSVRAALDGLRAGPLRALRWRSVRVDVSSDGRAGYTIGYGERSPAAVDSTAPIKYIAFWRRGDADGWKLAALALAGGTRTPPAGAPAGCETPDADAALASGTFGDTLGRGVIDADAAFAALSAREGPAAAFGEYIAADGIMLGGAGPMSCGKAPVAKAFEGATPADILWTPRLGYVAGSGDLGFTVGVAHLRTQGGAITTKYLTIWKRQHDGRWRFVADGGNASPPDA